MNNGEAAGWALEQALSQAQGFGIVHHYTRPFTSPVSLTFNVNDTIEHNNLLDVGPFCSQGAHIEWRTTEGTATANAWPPDGIGQWEFIAQLEIMLPGFGLSEAMQQVYGHQAAKAAVAWRPQPTGEIERINLVERSQPLKLEYICQPAMPTPYPLTIGISSGVAEDLRLESTIIELNSVANIEFVEPLRFILTCQRIQADNTDSFRDDLRRLRCHAYLSAFYPGTERYRLRLNIVELKPNTQGGREMVRIGGYNNRLSGPWWELIIEKAVVIDTLADLLASFPSLAQLDRWLWWMAYGALGADPKQYFQKKRRAP